MSSSKRVRRGVAASRARTARPATRFKLAFLESALREWQALDGSVKGVFKKHLEARLATPRFPGSELHGPLVGCYKIKLRAQGYRLVYQVRDDVLVVLVIVIDRRDKGKVYQAAMKRLDDSADGAAHSRKPGRGRS